MKDPEHQFESQQVETINNYQQHEKDLTNSVNCKSMFHQFGSISFYSTSSAPSTAVVSADVSADASADAAVPGYSCSSSSSSSTLTKWSPVNTLQHKR